MSGTFNVVRDRAKAGDEKFRQDVVFLALTQGQLRERAEGLVGADQGARRRRPIRR